LICLLFSKKSRITKQKMKVIKKIHNWLLAALTIGLATSPMACSQTENSTQISFNKHIRPIINEKCISCHGGVKENGKLSFLTREEALDITESGHPAIIPGHADSSELIARLIHHDPELRMPYEKDPLSEEEIRKMRTWINQGADWEEHWAFIPPEKNLQPPAINDDWIQNGIDAFILEKLEEKGWKHAKEADPHTLIRRVSLDLTGLPPTPEEVEAFMNDKSENAYENMVDRYLQSPHFGEKWAAMWMDLARYGDSQGYQKDNPRNIWRYRDWLITAFNEDMPFDQFTIEQLAGDLLEDPDDQQILATAFHRNTMCNDEGGTDDEEFRVAAVLDRVNTTFEIWQGLTVSCVQCHSHPYDPIRHQEFYELYAFFNNTEDADRTDEWPTQKLFSKAQEEEIDAIKTWLKEKEIIPKNNKGDYKQAIGNYYLTPDLASDYQKAQIRNRDDGAMLIRVKDGAYLKYAALDLTGVKAVEARYVSNSDGGRITLRLNSPKGKIIGQTTLASTGSWASRLANDWNRIPIEIEPTAGKHDLYVVFTHPEGKGICDFKSLFLQPEGMTDASEVKRKIERISAIQPGKTPIMRELQGEDRRKTHVFVRGNWLVHGEEVAPDVPAILSPLKKDQPKNRLGLARWLVDPENPLTARVIVNRFWEQIFGVGIVKTIEDFGSQGDQPSHPEMLDWLALQFANEHQWSVKSLLKQMVMSSAYRQHSGVSAEMLEADPDNRYLARGPRFRLTAEQIRDQALAVSGLLSRKMYGPSVMPPQPEGTWQVIRNVLTWDSNDGEDRYRRGLYTFWRKSSPYPAMMIFDSPSKEFCVSRRIRTNTPLQALVTLNDTAFFEAAVTFAERMIQKGGDAYESQIEYGYKLAMGGKNDREKIRYLERFYENTLRQYQKDADAVHQLLPEKESPSPELATMVNVANVIMNLDEFVTKN
jgi:hypothetical protein